MTYIPQEQGLHVKHPDGVKLLKLIINLIKNQFIPWSR